MSGLYRQEPNMRNKGLKLPLTQGQLKALHPYLFSSPGVTRLGFAAGWMQDIVSMSVLA